MKKPHFICIEGLDGSGKTTQAKLLAESLNAIYTKEPSDLPIGRLIREYLKNEKLTIDHHTFQLMYAADRGEHVIKEILTSLKNNQTVITDRYFLSSIAFGAAMGLDFDWLNQINKYFPAPDLCFYLNTPIEICLERINFRDPGKNHEFFEKKDTLLRVEENYQKMIENYYDILSIHPKNNQSSTLYVINGEQSIERINQDISKILTKEYV
ncbi:MAG: dTMP kinase [Patescibacteria group bacterium]